ncbi:MDIS1-interacting receptor like kinase 2-like [Tripterygium wilfordii]|uniref:MDIS1-interacting receptor like kinase 2-like n=1 Tax=Tripterygium wilfordii TaxID=458696 RepID=UPI0018F835F5|nr:MDIS1-interacting receptor like kinase 2-like [Tripterygium wilfordii]
MENLAKRILYHDLSLPIIHRDISSKNILLDLEYEACVSDFRIAKLLKQDSFNWSKLTGTHGYIAPDLTYTIKVTKKYDVYNFGVLALEVLKGSHPGLIVLESPPISFGFQFIHVLLIDYIRQIQDHLQLLRVLSDSTKLDTCCVGRFSDIL